MSIRVHTCPSVVIFVLVDESHRSVYGETGAKMEKVLPNGCFIGFIGTPLMKKEHKTANKFGGYIEPSYLSKVSEIMEAVLERTGDNLPPELRGHDVAKAFYGIVNEVLEGVIHKEDPVPYRATSEAAELALKIDEEVQKRLQVDWRSNPDVQNQMRNAIDDLLYEARAGKGILLTPQDMDTIIEQALEIAKNRYQR